MTHLSHDLIARITRRALDPKRRYMTAADDEALVSLPTGDIEQRLDAAEAGSADMFREMLARLQANGFPTPTMSFGASGGNMRTTTDAPGAKPLTPPPTDAEWPALEAIVGRPIPDDLRSLYTISDGGFGPGFTGLHPVQMIGAAYEDFRRRGPDYCGTIAYPPSFLPIAGEMLDYHYDLDTGRIISSDSHWDDHDLEPEDIYDIAHQSLAAMMEHWLHS